MAGFYGLEQREVIRVKVKKCDGFMQPEYKKFSLDPQITSFEMLQHILANAFGIKGDFTLSYRARDDEGQEIYLSMLSDWDMDAAFQSASDPCLQLKVDLKPFEEGLDDWDIIAPVDVPQYKISNLAEKNSIFGALTGTISNQMGRTLTQMQKAMGLKGEVDNRYKPTKPPMTDLEFRNYLDSSGHMVKPEEFRLSIYQGGVEPSLRRVVWRHLLNIFPLGLSGKERFDYMKKKEKEYLQLRDDWKGKIGESASEEIRYVASLVKKDVLRTDRTQKFFSGGDDSKNLLSLFNILVTYALTHPEVSYCQGMSDIASPLLVTQKEEAQAYLCFCGIMDRLKPNFMLNENAMNLKFKHLADVLQLHDPVLCAYFRDINANDMFFCYRWLLLELKREFPFDDALYMLEVMWSTLPPNAPEGELALTDHDYSPALLSTSPCSPSFSMKQTVYAKLLALRTNRHRSKPKETLKNNETSESNGEVVDSNNSVNNNSILVSKNMSDKASPFEDEKGILSSSQDFPSMEDSMLEAVQAQSCSIDKSLEGVKRDKLGSDLKHVKRIIAENDELQENDQHSQQTNGECTPTEKSDKTNCSAFTDSAMNNSIHDEKPAGSFYNGDVSVELENSHFEGNNELGEKLVEHSSDNQDSTYESAKALDDAEYEEDFTHEDDDSGQSQFYMSLESESGDSKVTETKDLVSNQVKKQPERVSFFKNVKEMISTPKKRPTNIPLPPVPGFQEPESENKTVEKNGSCTSGSSGGDSDTIFQQSSASNSSSVKNVGNPTTSTVKDRPPLEVVKHSNNISDTNCNASKTTFNDSGMSLTSEDGDSSLEVIKHMSISVTLPSPDVFGDGNPFLMFLCVTLLVQHRDAILQNQLEYDEIAMMFDKMVRKHNVHKVLHQARLLYTDYLQSQKRAEENLQDTPSDNCSV